MEPLELKAPPLPVSLYVHVPFCVSKCAYCDFVSGVRNEALHRPYVDAVLFQAGHWSHFDLLDDVPSLYLGGGTPTALGEELVRLLIGLRETARLRSEAEVTVETNPDTTDLGLVAALVAAGANRFSLGVQSFDDDVLRFLGRRHDGAAAESAARALRDSGAAFSVDLMCGIPGQSSASWRDSLERAVATGAGHVSVYPLSVEEGTPLAVRVDAGAAPAADPDRAAEMMASAQDVLARAGFERYEVANYARPGQRARHNVVYWTGGAYLGLGPAASSMLPVSQFLEVADSEGWARPTSTDGTTVASAPPGAARARFTATDDFDGYLHRPLQSPREVEYLTAEEAAREDVMLGMRLADGVSAGAVDAAGVRDALEALERDGLVARFEDSEGARWRTTPRGWLLGNEVFGRIWNTE